MISGRSTTRFSYTASEVGGQLIFCVISFYLLKFYTDVYGISAASAGTILLVARCVDAFDAPVWGIVFEKTHSRWGRSRPWFLWLCVPFATFGVLTFSTPSMSQNARILYATLTYIASSVLYTGINTPVTSILASLTPDSAERVVLTTFRMFGSKMGVLFVNLTLLRGVSFLGHGNDRLGYMRVLPLYAAGSVLLYLTAFRNLRERPHESAARHTIRASLSAFRGNAPWLIIFLSSLFFWIAFIARISSTPYFFQYVLHRPDLLSLANSLDVVSLGGIFFLPALCRRISKCKVWTFGLLGCALAQLLVFFAMRQASLSGVLAAWALGFIASGPAMAIPFSALSDSIDYGEWKSGIRAAGLLSAVGAAFCLKAGSGLGGALPAWILAGSGYLPNVNQTSRSLAGIQVSTIWLPALCYLLALIPVLFYHRYERLEPRIQSELEQRRRAAALVSQAL